MGEAGGVVRVVGVVGAGDAGDAGDAVGVGDVAVRVCSWVLWVPSCSPWGREEASARTRSVLVVVIRGPGLSGPRPALSARGLYTTLWWYSIVWNVVESAVGVVSSRFVSFVWWPQRHLNVATKFAIANFRALRTYPSTCLPVRRLEKREKSVGTRWGRVEFMRRRRESRQS